MIVRTYKSIKSPLNIWFCLYKTFTLHSLSCPARRAGAETEAARLLSFLSSLCSCPASPDWSALQTWWSVVWWWSRWAALRSGSGRRRSLWRFVSVPVLYCPSLETETKKRQPSAWCTKYTGLTVQRPTYEEAIVEKQEVLVCVATNITLFCSKQTGKQTASQRWHCLERWLLLNVEDISNFWFLKNYMLNWK